MLDSRKGAILRAIVREFVRAGQPVGSKALTEKLGLAFDKNWAVIPAPRFVGRDEEKFDMGNIDLFQKESHLVLVIHIHHVNPDFLGTA